MLAVTLAFATNVAYADTINLSSDTDTITIISEGGRQDATTAPATVSRLTTFPSSSVTPQGSSWRTMHKDGYTGGFAEACNLLGLSGNECRKYESMHNTGQCSVLNVPDGIVLDRLVFTKGGKHRVQQNVRVDLKNPPTRETTVCDLGGGVYAMRFHGCGNHALVRTYSTRVEVLPPAPKPVPLAPKLTLIPMDGCKNSKTLNILIASSSALRSDVRGTIAATKGGGFFAEDRVSRKYGEAYWDAYRRGEVEVSRETYNVAIFYIKFNGEQAYSSPIGHYTVHDGVLAVFLPKLEEYDGVGAVFDKDANLASPKISDTTGRREIWAKSSEWGEHCEGYALAFERPPIM